MHEAKVRELLTQVATGACGVDEATRRLRDLPFADLGYANVDHHRNLRQGFPEVIYSQGKTIPQVLGILERLVPRNNAVMATRASEELAGAVRKAYPEAVWHPEARILVLNAGAVKPAGAGKAIAVVTAGTSDIPVAEEAAVTAETMGNAVDRIYDVGVAGIHRLFARLERINAANVVIVAAGMEGALPSVIGGLVDKPVIAVPTSIGYGASFNGLAALLAMLNTCASGIGVVNIDNGFGAGYLASTINRLSIVSERDL